MIQQGKLLKPRYNMQKTMMKAEQESSVTAGVSCSFSIKIARAG
jgi:hypothetical protein